MFSHDVILSTKIEYMYLSLLWIEWSLNTSDSFYFYVYTSSSCIACHSEWYQTLYETAYDKTKWPVCPAKTRISLGIRTVWSVFTVHMKKLQIKQLPIKRAAKTDQTEQNWSDWADAQADLSLCWAHVCWFCVLWLICNSKPFLYPVIVEEGYKHYYF